MKKKGNVLIVGGGDMGYFLAKNLVREGYRTSVLDLEHERSQRIANELGIVAYTGDGTDIECLRALGTKDAGYVIAMTSDDEVNLVICQIAKREFGVRMTIARISDPQNEELFSKLGVNETVCASSIAIRMIEEILPARGIRLLSAIGKSTAEIDEFSLDALSPSVDMPICDLKLPAECVLAAIARGDDVIIPRGDTVLRSGDRVYAISREETLPAMKHALLGA